MTKTKNILLRCTALVLTALLLQGCFKKVSHDTELLVKPNLQVASGAEMVEAEGVVISAWFNRGDGWSVASYDDALAGRLTNTEDGTVEVIEPDAVSESDGNGRLRLELKSASVLLAAIYPQAKMYAWRILATAENLSPTYITVQFRPWKQAPYEDSLWKVGFADDPSNNDDDTDNE